MTRALVMAPRVLVGALVLFAIGVMLYGVLCRYVLLPITDWLDVDPVTFFWVEEVGEAALAWMTLVGAAIGVGERTHFTLNVLVHKFPPGVQRAIHVVNHVLIMGFAALVAWIGFKLAQLNAPLTSPGLEFSLAWLYVPASIGGILMMIYALAAARDHHDHEITDVRE